VTLNPFQYRSEVGTSGTRSPAKPHPAPVRLAVCIIRKVQAKLRSDDRQCLVDNVGAALAHPAKTTRRPCPETACAAGTPAARSIPRRPRS